MAFTSYHNILGSVNTDPVLIAKNEGPNNLKNITITNVHASADATIDLSIQNLDSGGEIYYFVKSLVIVSEASYIIDIPALNNAIYSLVMTVGSSDTVDVIIN